MKYIAGISLFVFSFLILGASHYLYLYHYVEIAGVVIDGAPYLPEYIIDYSLYTGDLLLAI
jgi:hypothetical protein